MPLCVICGEALVCSHAAENHSGQTGVEKPCALKKAALWVNVMDDAGEAVKEIQVDVAGAKKSTEPSGFARFDPVKDSETLTVKLPDNLPDKYDVPETKSSQVRLSPGEVGYLGFSLPRKPKPKVKVFNTKANKLFGDADVTITGKDKREKGKGKTEDGTGLTDPMMVTADKYGIEVTLKSGDEKDFFVPEIPDVTLEAGDDQEIPVEVVPVNVVTPKIEVEYKVVLLDRKLSAHKVGGEDPIYADPTRIEVSFVETNADHPHVTGAKVELDPPDGAKIYSDPDCKNELAGDLTKDDLLNGKVKELYLRGTKAGALKVKVTLKDPDVGDKKKIRLDKNPAESAMAVVELVLEAYSAKKAHSKVFVDDDAPTHTKLTDEGKVKKGRILALQDGGKHGRAKVIIKKPDDALWTTGDADYEVHLASKGASGALKLFDAEKAGNLKQDLASGALKLKKDDLGGDVTLWVEGAGATNDFREAWLHLALDRPVRDLAKTVKACGDVARFTVIEITEITPTLDGKQYVNLPADTSFPRRGREITSKVKLGKALQDVEVMFSLIPHVDSGGDLSKSNRTDLLAKLKHTKAEDSDAAVKTSGGGEAESAKLKLSGYGGDKFAVAAYLLEAPPLGKEVPDKSKSKQLEIWKKLEYRLLCMKRSDGSDYSNRVNEATLQAEYEKSFIEMTRTGSVKIADHTLVISKLVVDGWADGELGSGAPARTIDFALIDILDSGRAAIPFDFEVDASANVEQKTYSGDDYCFDLSAQDKWLVSAEYYDLNVGVGSTLTIPGAKVTLELSGLDFLLKVDVGDIVTGGLPLNRIHLVLKLQKLDDISGVSSGATTVAAMRWREKGYPGDEEDAAVHTLLHESGHFNGLAAKKLPDAAQNDNGNFYDNPGIGEHCNYGTNTCIMYHAFRLTMAFCPNCAQALRARDLETPPVDATTDY